MARKAKQASSTAAATRELIGHYFLGFEGVLVYVDTASNDGGAKLPGHWQREGRRDTGKIIVGIDTNSWGTVLENILHESLEYLLVQNGYSYEKGLRMANNAGSPTFMLTHEQFTEVVARQAEFVRYCQNPIAVAHKRHMRVMAKAKAKAAKAAKRRH